MGKLHELLAVEGDLEGVNKSVLEEAKHTLKGKPDHFLGSVKTYRPLSDGDPDLVAPEFKEMVTTVHDKLNYVWEHVVRYLDAVLQKETTNQSARADIVLSDGRTLVKDVPATFLLGLESKIKQWKDVLQDIPTLAPGISWKKDASSGEHVYVTEHPEETRRTRKTVQHKILVNPSKEHPAQVEKWTEDVPIGVFTKTTTCGMLSSAEKSTLLGRLDELSRAVKQARQRANCAEAVNDRVGQSLIDFVMKGSATSDT
jgi:hypothetical protein